MRIDVLCLFPEMFASPLEQSIVKRARERGLVDIRVWNIRDHAHDRHRTVDDYPYGGGPGMVMKPEPVFEAVEERLSEGVVDDVPVVLLTPQGRLFSQEAAREFARYARLVLLCGHYEGVDERIREHLVTDEISIGDYVLSGGEIAAMVVIDAVVRLVPGVLGSATSAESESHGEGLLEYPQYTRPSTYRGWEVPQVLLSGNHAEVAAWRRRQALLRTAERRPDLIEKANLSDRERQWISEKLSSRS
ncbi:MAG: tRNA (guanosine(37)-N1)-methyltransferase TrmD [Chloroflexota bacterium]